MIGFEILLLSLLTIILLWLVIIWLLSINMTSSSEKIQFVLYMNSLTYGSSGDGDYSAIYMYTYPQLGVLQLDTPNHNQINWVWNFNKNDRDL